MTCFPLRPVTFFKRIRPTQNCAHVEFGRAVRVLSQGRAASGGEQQALDCVSADRGWFVALTPEIVLLVACMRRLVLGGRARRADGRGISATDHRPSASTRSDAALISVERVAVWVETKNGPKGPYSLTSWRRAWDSNPRRP
jgi:hypothetical protein